MTKFTIALVAVLAGAAFAAPPPPPPRGPAPHKAPVVKHQGRAHWPAYAKPCDSCGGDGWKRRWYGAKVTCGVCDGRGYNIHKVPPPKPAVKAPPPPPKHGNPPPRR